MKVTESKTQVSVMFISVLIAVLCLPTFVGAQSSMQDWVDSIGDKPGAHPCSKLITQMNRAKRAHDQGVSDAEIQHRVLHDDPQASEAIAVAHMPGNFGVNAGNEQIKCERKYHMGTNN